MKHAAFALITCAAVTAAPVALAQGTRAQGASSGDDEGCACACPGHASAHVEAAEPGGAAETPVGTATVTSVRVAVPMGPVHREPETVVARQRILPNRPLLYTGGAMLAGAYLTSAALTATRALENPDKTLYIPVVGPWLHLKDIPEGARDKILIAGSGVVQGAGLALTVASFFLPQKIPAAVITSGDVKMNVTPTAFGPGSAGAMAVGRF